MMEEGRIRTRRSHFSQISNSAIDSLDPDSLWLYVRMYSKANIPGYTLYKKSIEQSAKEYGIGRVRFNRAWSLLIKSGYIKQYRLKDVTGHFYYEYEVLEDPEPLQENLPEEHTEDFTEKSAAALPDPEEEKATAAAVEPYSNVPLCSSPYSSLLYTSELHSSAPYSSNMPPINNTRINNTGINNTISSSSTAEYQCSEDEARTLAAVPSSVQCDQGYSAGAVLATIEEALAHKPDTNELKKIIRNASARYNRKDRSGGVKKPFAYFLEVLSDMAGQKTGSDQSGAAVIKPNAFHNFHQRDYDYAQLEKAILNAQW